jgi:hypothetical protein
MDGEILLQFAIAEGRGLPNTPSQDSARKNGMLGLRQRAAGRNRKEGPLVLSRNRSHPSGNLANTDNRAREAIYLLTHVEL